MDKIYIHADVQAQMQQGYFGGAERPDDAGIRGWVLPWDFSDIPTTLTVLANGIPIGTAYSGTATPDVSRLIRRPVACGFSFSFAESDLSGLASTDEEEISLEVRITGTDYYIPVLGGGMTAGALRRMSAGKKAAAANFLTETDRAAFFAGLPGQQAGSVASKSDVRLIAFYLPQFHPIPENDEWWGRGFTEWTNVSQARPLFDGHYQPHLPADLGFYDLRVPEVREAQAELASRHGIFGFCYYYYWFAGRRILDRPLREVFESGKPDFPFCICWANETWSRRWDGSENEVLIKQEHSFENDVKFINDVIPLMKDPRYIRVDGAPVLVVYRVSLFPNAVRTADLWRSICAQNGIERIHLCSAETFGITEPRQYGFDASVEFPPHTTVSQLINTQMKHLAPDHTGNIYDYEQVVHHELNKISPPYRRYPGVMLSWDNTPRRGKAGNVFMHTSPNLYELWLRGAIDRTRRDLPAGERIVFINAWNEWAEGTHLEPDQRFGCQYLEATKRALSGASDWKALLEYGRSVQRLEGEAKNALLKDLSYSLEKYEQSLRYMAKLVAPATMPWGIQRFSKSLPRLLEKLPIKQKGDAFLERINQFPGLARVTLDRRQAMSLNGWAFCDGVVLSPDSQAYFELRSVEGEEVYYAGLVARTERTDVMRACTHSAAAYTRFSGFHFLGSLEDVAPGDYGLSIIHLSDAAAFAFRFKGVVTIE